MAPFGSKLTRIVLLIVLAALSLPAGPGIYFNGPIGERINASRLFWKKIYGEIDSTSTVIFDKSSLAMYGIYKNELAANALDSLKKAVRHPKKLKEKQGRKEFIRDAITRAQRYQFIADTLQNYNLHPDLRWLPVLESGYLEDMVSEKGAKGLWQFIESTGAKYGLSPPDIVDPYKATSAFARYFSMLYKETDDYGLALTAYHHGEDGIRQKLKKRAAKRLDAILPDLGFESRNYYGRLLAIIDIAKTSPALPAITPVNDTTR